MLVDRTPAQGLDPAPVLAQGEYTTRAVVVHALDLAAGAVIAAHAHRRGQLLHATEGVMLVRTGDGSWVVPPGCAVWVPPQMPHAIRSAAGVVAMRTVFVEPQLRDGLPAACAVIRATALLRELVLEAIELPLDYPLGGREERLMQLILDEIERARPLALHVPIPQHAGLAQCCRDFVDDPAREASLAAWGQQLHMHPRTLARLFQRETGMNFGAWCRHARLLLSLPRLAAGASVLEVALAHGYDSPSAFSAIFRRHFGVPPSAYLHR